MTSKAERFATLLGTSPDTLGSAIGAAHKHNFCDTSPLGMKFVPINAVLKFPYKFMKKSQGEPVSIQFFAGGKFWDRDWDLWYIYSPFYHSERPIIFVPLEQFNQLLKEIDGAFPSYLVRMPNNAEGSLVFPFEYSDHKLLRPHFLGQSSSKDDFERLNSSVPHFGALKAGETEPEHLSYFRRDMEAAVDAGKNKGKSKAGKEAKQEARVIQQHNMYRQVERTQVSLGLSLPSEAIPDSDVIYIAVDVESYEKNHNIITEIGFATLDTRDLKGLSHGEAGKDWHKFIRARHFRVSEYKHYTNSEFVRGCPDKFEFGDSEFVDLKDVPRAIASCFKHPYSAQDTNEEEEERRNIIFVGHDTKQDIAYLRKLGYDPSNLANLQATQDTALMWRALTGEPNARGLSHIMYALDLESWNTHNAGNDAVYTVHAMIGCCIKGLKDKAAKKNEDDEGGVGLLPEKKTNIEKEIKKITKKFVEWDM
ncbi:hypothetical protein AUEXF2481DRAFT_32417 [Aureobasidium subglaciale EXF-2481]|uniref:Gfd2/YDR514C-like C-terminal domain-containing protein n=1 Tax=Aureobasidium subglaciale (strain EXF-2481) TaxID=1043005 RepID=A0A074Y3D4_AURSE|nr:uncharacterized protein AUEXF2481DRAFT_32417 [Aureobasidium subglaciale EXF-2481]KAI5207987.1 hypothetical protein E4T38_03081 [Aureobasidium subglaciale]KAI5226931.1 hypothetical protein E4T40_02855 [Aureobasidium subglaciale]KAI5230070.1 hypothetical protein E4T41_03078 [Aureobasidium subglaciale]KAI5264590.1 hypothetical protein E4T46_02856 [Aureobasidium subglaciale]KEQ92215.1 hypothetical protein AUEXF2481DRAFT_32417 [Aureobasidium subglaciale EXF-2481]